MSSVKEKLNSASVIAIYGALGHDIRPAFVADVISQLHALTTKEARPILTALLQETKDAPEINSMCKIWRNQRRQLARQRRAEELVKAKERRQARKDEWREQITANVLGQNLRYLAAFDANESMPTPDNEQAVLDALSNLRGVIRSACDPSYKWKKSQISQEENR